MSAIIELDQKAISAISDIEDAIAILREEYLPLKINGVDDSTGYKAVFAARQDVKQRRIKVEKMRKDGKAIALEFGRKIDGEAKRITEMLDPIEKHLEDQEAIYNAEKERIKREAEERRKAILQARVEAISATGERPVITLLQQMTDDEYLAELRRCKAAQAERERIAAEEKALREKEAADLAEKQRIFAEEQAKAEAAAKVERERIAAEAEKLKAERDKLEAEHRAIEAAENARLQAEAKAKRDAELAEQRERERLAAIEAGKREAEELARRKAEEDAARIAAEEAERKRIEELKPDAEKIELLAKSIVSTGECLRLSVASSEEAKKVQKLVNACADGLRKIAAGMRGV